MMQAYVAGLLLGFSLILAIGAQNAFVLKQGLMRDRVFLVCLICAVSDALLIALGVSGFSVAINILPSLETAARYAGALFLAAYGMISLYHALFRRQHLDVDTRPQTTTRNIVLYTLAFTWLNPHVYLDTVLLIGSVSTGFVDETLWFGLGAVSASFVFFFSLGYAARLLIPLFRRSIAWAVLDALIGVFMIGLSLSLILTS